MCVNINTTMTRFRFLSRSYYRNSAGVLVAYSVIRKDSFKGVERSVESVGIWLCHLEFLSDLGFL